MFSFTDACVPRSPCSSTCPPARSALRFCRPRSVAALTRGLLQPASTDCTLCHVPADGRVAAPDGHVWCVRCSRRRPSLAPHARLTLQHAHSLALPRAGQNPSQVRRLSLYSVNAPLKSIACTGNPPSRFPVPRRGTAHPPRPPRQGARRTATWPPQDAQYRKGQAVVRAELRGARIFRPDCPRRLRLTLPSPSFRSSSTSLDPNSHQSSMTRCCEHRKSRRASRSPYPTRPSPNT